MRLTLYGIENYLEDEGGLFTNIVLPPERYDKQILVDLIIDECGDLYPYYQVPEVLKRQIEQFFARYKEQFKRAWDALYSDYNPIENYDRIENWSDSMSSSESTSESVSAQTSSSDSNSTVNDVSAYNGQSFVHDTAANGLSAGRTDNHTDGKASRDYEDYKEHGGRIHGNIGVKTTQSMIGESLDLANYDIYLWVVMLFRKKIISSIL